jgi:ABC-type transport system involved in multi-copper enzyme maturation permease subunit
MKLRRHLPAVGHLRPDRLFFGPLFDAQMRIVGRMRGTYLLRAIFAGLFAFIAFASGAEPFLVGYTKGLGPNDEIRTPVQRLQAMQEVAPAITSSILSTLMFCVVVASPLIFGPTIGDDRRAGRIPSLLTTPLRPVQIVASKLAAQTVHLMILTLLALPTLMAFRVFGGLPAATILAGTAIILSTGILGAALSIMFSASARKSITAVSAAVASLILLFIAPWILSAVVQSELGWRIPDEVLMAFSAPGALAVVLSRLQPISTIVAAAAANSAVSLGLATLAVGWAARSLRRSQESETRVAAPTSTKKTESPKPIRDPSIGDPIFWKEIHNSSKKLVRGERRAAIIGIIAILAGHYLARDFPPVFQFLFWGGTTILLVAAATVRSAACFTSERESRSLDVLLTTPCSPRAIVRGKFLGALAKPWRLPAVMAFNLVFSCAIGALHPIALIFLPIVLLPPVCLITATGLLFSLRSKTTFLASGLNLALAMVLWAGIPLLIEIISGVLRNFEMASTRADPLRSYYSTHPLFSSLGTIAGTFVDGQRRGSSGFPSMTGRGGDVSQFEWFLSLLVAAVIYLLFTWLVLHIAARAFNRQTGRTS